MNYFIDMMFLGDIILMFFTSIMTKKGFESWNSGEVMTAYMSTSRFYLDCMSLLGSGIFLPISPYFTLFGMLKVGRVFRIGKMITQSTADKETKAVLGLLKLIFYLFLYLHIIACYYWICITYNVG